jgi:hypothetical protein
LSPCGRLGEVLGLVSRRQHEAVAHVADGADQRLVVGAELGAQSSYVDVDRAGKIVARTGADTVPGASALEDAETESESELETEGLSLRSVTR